MFDYSILLIFFFLHLFVDVFHIRPKCSYFVQRKIIGVDFNADWNRKKKHQCTRTKESERMKRFAQQNIHNFVKSACFVHILNWARHQQEMYEKYIVTMW